MSKLGAAYALGLENIGWPVSRYLPGAAYIVLSTPSRIDDAHPQGRSTIAVPHTLMIHP